MLRKKFLKSLGVAVLTIVISYTTMLLSLPKSIVVYEGEEESCSFEGPPGVVAHKSDEGLILKALGIFPLGTVKVDVVQDEYIMASGNVIGVKMSLDGLLVVSLSGIEIAAGNNVYPAKDGGLKIGDIIKTAQNEMLNDSYHLVNIVEKSGGNVVNLDIERNGENINIQLLPVKALADGKYHIGIWIRDTAAGMGTLTYYNHRTFKFGALGHGISDIDIGKLIPLKSGNLYQASIISIKKGITGTPGELSGIFMEDWGAIGSIEKNDECGIYGTLNAARKYAFEGKLIAMGSQSVAKEGSAIILSDIAGKGIKSYSIEIQKIARSPVSGKKSIILKVTDKALIDITGGIVQGMSGSPIIQDGRLIGAVTHVFVSDPLKGYGILLDQMYRQ